MKRLVLICALVSPVVLAADAIDVKTGLWEMTVSSTPSGVMIPPEVLDKMPPDQKAKLLAGLQARAAKGAVKHVSKDCVTAEDLKRSAFSQAQDQRCTIKYTQQTAKRQAGTMTCPPPGGSGEFDFQAVSREQMRGTINIRMATGGLKMDLAGQWLGASCAAADKHE